MKDYKEMWKDLKKSIEKSKNDFETDRSDKPVYEFVEYMMEQIENKKD